VLFETGITFNTTDFIVFELSFLTTTFFRGGGALLSGFNRKIKDLCYFRGGGLLLSEFYGIECHLVLYIDGGGGNCTQYDVYRTNHI